MRRKITVQALRELPRPIVSVWPADAPKLPHVEDAPCTEAQREILAALLWSDPTADGEPGMHASPRTAGSKRMGFERIQTFGPDVVRDFVQTEGVDVVVRAHECVQEGFLFFAAGHLVTVFSARNYAGQMNNAGAFLLVTLDDDAPLSQAPQNRSLTITAKCLASDKSVVSSSWGQNLRDVSPLRSASSYSHWGQPQPQSVLGRGMQQYPGTQQYKSAFNGSPYR